MAQQILSTNTFTTAKWIVSSTSSDGTHTTIATALTSASSGDTIFIRPGTYTENLTLKAGVNLTAFGSDSSLNGTGKVIISGTCTMTTAGSVTIYGIQLQTNSAALLAVTGSAASIVNLNNCYLNCTNNTGISYTSSSGSSAINLNNCTGDIGTTGIALFAHSSAGGLTFNDCVITNTGGSSTANTASAGTAQFNFCRFFTPITTSGTGAIGYSNSSISTSAQNVTGLTAGGSGNGNVTHAFITSGTASAISIGATLNVMSCNIDSSNANAITGAGTINASGLTFTGTSSTINTTTQSTCGTLQGSKVAAPTAGMLGEQIRSSVASGTAGITNNTATNITSISLTAGIWDVSALIVFDASAITGTSFAGSISTTSATRGTTRDAEAAIPTAPTASSTTVVSVPAYRITLTAASTTVYMVGFSLYSVGTLTASGRISATRVG